MDSVFFIPLVISALLFIALTTFLFIKMYEYRNPTMMYDVACAGMIHGEAEKMRSVSIMTDQFLDYEGHPLNVDDFYLFMVCGESMKLSGIHNRDIVFVPKNYSSDNETFPAVLVLKRENSKEGEAKYKIRRGWSIVQYADVDFEHVIRSIMNSKKFKSIKEDTAYPGDRAIMEDFFNERLQKYEREHPKDSRGRILISTTLHINENKIYFSIHPVELIVGKIVYSFTTNK